MRYDRTLIGYHGCDAEIAERLLTGEAFLPSENDYDWLGRGVYFWEFGYDRALRFATSQQRRGRLKKPAVVGAILQLGRCYDLLDTRCSLDLKGAYEVFVAELERLGQPLPRNAGKTPERKLRRLDSAVVNFWLGHLEQTHQLSYDTVRCAFWEGAPLYPESGFWEESHIQVAVRNPACILGVFRPSATR